MTQTIVELRLMEVSQTPAIAVAQSVKGHEIKPHLTRISGFQVTQLTPEIKSALTHDCGRQRGIQVRGNIPVIRDRHLRSVDVIEPQGRRQKARLALVTERKTEIRQRQQRQPLEAQ